MANIILVTGGARSGKSQFAEDLMKNHKKVCYIATGLSREEDSDWQERVRLHKKRRPATWDTREQYLGIGDWLQDQSYGAYLLDCASMLTTNVLFQRVAEVYPSKLSLSDDNFLTKTEQSMISQKVMAEWEDILTTLALKDTTFYIVTNEVGLGIVPETRLGSYFRDLLGNVNQRLAKEASEVYLVICGLAQRLK
ncbi:adenosylcobinamide kinase [Streptococcus varani]|uniref:Adenosylcobinamide kinase n=1 Tax=Streptococcus varani TaxID=1608583 RepID=A0A0E3WFJ1_9STRE|nr:bifunctional adenosylcobinamide kinase/adenosylcobinamide-phosphate guanylyltransferase [Streptococcus varani]CQR25612.1 adenosylcobinamide kinase [Streptococcus varani]